MSSPYYNEEEIRNQIRAGGHRNVIGGLWDELGNLQLDFLISQGLLPHHRLLDIGCGALRLGVMAVNYLEPGHYYGTDIWEELLDAGYHRELTDRQRERLPRANLAVTGDFNFSYLSEKMDYAIAQSLFSHLPMNHLRHCLMNLQQVMNPGGIFYVTFFHCPDHHDVSKPLTHPLEVSESRDLITRDVADPYHYTLSDMEYVAKDTQWRFQFIGDWKHPRNQQMAAYVLS